MDHHLSHLTPTSSPLPDNADMPRSPASPNLHSLLRERENVLKLRHGVALRPQLQYAVECWQPHHRRKRRVKIRSRLAKGYKDEVTLESINLLSLDKRNP